MKRLSATLATTALLLAALPAGAVLAQPSNFRAPLSGDEEVPEVDTRGTGVATFKDRTEGLVFKLNVANLEDVVAAHIHCGAAGADGPVGVTLFSGGPTSEPGTLAQGTITEPDAENGCEWGDLDDVMSALESGDTYVNVHTLAHPPGEVRGQIR